MRWINTGKVKSIDAATRKMSRMTGRDFASAPECEIKGAAKNNAIEYYINQRLVGKYEGMNVYLYAAN